jgi:hypothetical protein
MAFLHGESPRLRGLPTKAIHDVIWAAPGEQLIHTVAKIGTKKTLLSKFHWSLAPHSMKFCQFLPHKPHLLCHPASHVFPSGIPPRQPAFVSSPSNVWFTPTICYHSDNSFLINRAGNWALVTGSALRGVYFPGHHLPQPGEQAIFPAWLGLWTSLSLSLFVNPYIWSPKETISDKFCFHCIFQCFCLTLGPYFFLELFNVIVAAAFNAVTVRMANIYWVLIMCCAVLSITCVTSVNVHYCEVGTI